MLFRRNLMIPATAAMLVFPVFALAEDAVVEVFKSPTCGCCAKWISHLEEHGLTVTSTNVSDLSSIKRENGLPQELSSCHTAVVDGYIVEGHVPASDIQRLLDERPDIKGIAVPGMPLGSPGMEAPNPQAYTVYAFDESGNIEPYSTHEP